MATGTVRWFDVEQGHGFIKPDDGSKELLVHYRAIATPDPVKQLAEGQKVEYDYVSTEKGPMADNVVPL